MISREGREGELKIKKSRLVLGSIFLILSGSFLNIGRYFQLITWKTKVLGGESVEAYPLLQFRYLHTIDKFLFASFGLIGILFIVLSFKSEGN
ncbi:hypothetical protein [Alkaliphilus oremlandii]|uniref:Uncharacterized protein n=1 Tax=Alkaliphilus oremlandii (strain OhILAs) TaxID=350688 RepID=A8MIY1_ALKOO|nr:hypothetical protein [Alkaliphilus oremlandii]ABW19763.1 hypothetical protein Clos_2228 [Alkaliphilus oremlandii OhILAs]